jgi:putative ABC transport system permease protein
MRKFRRFFRHEPVRPDQLALEMDDEIQSHLAARTEQLERLGMKPEDARAEALRRFGDVASAGYDSNVAATRRHPRGIRAMTTGLSHDVRLALRALRLRPGFAAATVATLGLAIAAAVTAFSFIDAVFLRSLPAPSAERLVHVYLPTRDGGVTRVGRAGVSLLRGRRDVFETVAAETCCWVKFARERGTLDQRFVAFASSEFFPMLGLAPRLGRFFLPSETSTPGTEPVAVISYSLWQRTFGGDERALGEHVAIAGRDFTIIGVAPEGFDGIEIGGARSEMWLPTTMTAAVLGNGCVLGVPCQDSDVLARLVPGVSITQAQASLAGLGGELSRLAIGDDSIRKPLVVRASGALVQTQNEYASLARLLAATAGVLLLIACANLSGLLIVRGVSRSREIAIRLSLGAHRLRVARQLLVENGVLALLGGLFGLALSLWTSQQLMGFFVTDSEGFENYFRVGLDARILWFALGISVASTLLFGIFPALLTTRAQPAAVLKGGTPAGGTRTRFELITVQVALTSALLSGAVLLSRSFSHLLYAQKFDAGHVALFRVRPAAAEYDTLRSEQYVNTLAERVAALPGVENVAFARGAGFTWSESPVEVGVGTVAGDSARHVEAHFVSPGFFHTVRVAVLEGREFAGGDNAGAALVAMVNASLASELAPTSNVLGRTLYARGKAFRIIGVVPDYQVRLRGERASPMAFFAFRQNALGPERDARFAVRVRGDPAAALPMLRHAALSVDPNVPVAELMTLTRQIDANYPQIRLGQTVLLAAGGLALLLSVIGLYGMVAFLVTRRTREIGLRIALGATPARVAGRLIVNGMTAVLLGIAIGMVGAWPLSHLLGAWLVGVAPHDAVAFAIAALSVIAAAVVACAIPAQRAARIDPAIALRVE